MTHSTLRPVSCASQGRVAVDRLAGLILGVEPPTVSLATGSPAGAGASDERERSERNARQERLRLARQLRARRRTRIIGRQGL